MTQDFYDPKKITTGITLLPFHNQVGGHTSIFRFSKKTICKPATQREQQVYDYLETHHPELLPFLSQYLGVLNVTYHQKNLHLLPEVIFEKNEKLLDDWKNMNNLDDHNNNNNNNNITPDILEKDLQQWSPNADECNMRFKAFRKRVLREALSPNALKERLKMVHDWNNNNNNNNKENDDCSMIITSKRPSIISCTTSAPQSPRLLAAFNKTSSSDPPATLITSTSTSTTTTNSARWQPRKIPDNPWSQQVYEKDRQRLLQLEKSEVVKQFILLEDLTDEVQFPCVLDLKMGTRQHGVYAKKSKVKSQTEKCQTSTSGTLGVRICGMQVYQGDEFLFYDKYSGRQLSVSGFKSTLEKYFHNKRQVNQIPVLLRKLCRLSKIIQSLKGYRFYGSSLLIIYDASGKNNKIDVRMIDFAKTLTPDQDTNEFTCPPKRPNDPDHGYLLGLNSLIDCFTHIYNEHDNT